MNIGTFIKPNEKLIKRVRIGNLISTYMKTAYKSLLLHKTHIFKVWIRSEFQNRLLAKKQCCV